MATRNTHRAETKARALDNCSAMVVAIMNQARVAKTFRLTLPAGYATARAFFTGEAAAPGAEVTVELAPGDARAWVLTR